MEQYVEMAAAAHTRLTSYSLLKLLSTVCIDYTCTIKLLQCVLLIVHLPRPDPPVLGVQPLPARPLPQSEYHCTKGNHN